MQKYKKILPTKKEVEAILDFFMPVDRRKSEPEPEPVIPVEPEKKAD
jgi:hypothetical protein